MTTIQHRPAHLHPSWYAVGAVLTAAVLVLVLATLYVVYSGPDNPAPGIDKVATVHYRPAPPSCFAGRPNATSDLGRSGCATRP